MIALLLILSAIAETVRIGLFVGNNIGFGEDEPLSYAESEARDMARIFQEMGNLSRDRTYLLQGASAAEIRQTIYQVEAQAREAQARGDEVMVIFFYSGHPGGPAGVFRLTRTLDTPKLNSFLNRR